MSPQRIQRKRTKGWRMRESAVYVGRPTRWGNPFRVGDFTNIGERNRWPMRHTRATAVEAYREATLSTRWRNEVKRALRGRDLACWCPLDEPCHADVLLDIANEVTP